MRIIFMGTAEFAVPSLSIFLESNHEVVAIVTVPDKTQGRGLKIKYSPVKEFALKHHLKILQPEKLRDEHFISEVKKLNADLIVVVAFRILPKEIFLLPKFGSINLHASLLPAYRGAAPINWAIINGEKETGVTTFFLKEKVDEGNVILQAKIKIGENETAGELHDTLSDVGAEVVLHTVNLIENGNMKPKIQDETKATNAPKIFTVNCKINWSKTAEEIHNFVRGLSPSPSTYTYYNDTKIKIYKTRITTEDFHHTAGEILEANERIITSTGNGSIEILELQREGKKRMEAQEFLRGFHLKAGEKFD